ncbi:MAG: hypothetical protein ACOCZU_03710 [Planctomycetota bacterium]
MNNLTRQPCRADRQNRPWRDARRLVRRRRWIRRWLPYAAVPALMFAAMFTPSEAIEPQAGPVAPSLDELPSRAEDVENVKPADGLGGREADKQTPTPTHVESEGDTI